MMEKKESKITDQQRVSKYYNLINSTRAFKTVKRSLPIAEELFFLGVPQFTESIPTAAVDVNEDGEVTYLWNPSFFDENMDYTANYNYYSYNLPEVYFVSLHEALHVVLDHIFRREDRNPKLWNYACDIVINEALFDMLHSKNYYGGYYTHCSYGIKTPQKILRADQFGLTTEQVLEMSSEEVYDYLISEGHGSGKGESDNEGEANGPASGGGGGDQKDEGQGGSGGSEEDKDKKQANTGSHDNWDEIADNVDQDIVDARNNEVFSDYSDSSNSETWGSLAAGEIFKFGRINKEVDWDKVLFDHLASKIGGPPQTEEKWAPANRRLQSFYPNVLLPVEHREIGKKLIKILVAIDTSGSINDKQLQGFINVVAALPEDRTEVEIVYFDVSYYNGDWDEFKKGKIKIQGRGGTSFRAIQNKIEDMDEYPDEVLVLTDGGAASIRIPEEKKDRWVWVLTRKGSDYNIKYSGGKVIKINNIV
jgi:predicted metal-dependent peptidase